MTTTDAPAAASPELELLAINTVRTLAVDAVEQAQSGHAGAPMGLAPLGYRLFTRYLKHDPADHDWVDRDRFVLSNGHASILLYALLHLSGYDVELDDLKRFRQLNSGTPGHPEHFETPGVETTTGPLGQGFANAVGMALAERMLAARYNRDGHEIVDHRTWVFASDGDMMEGVASEAASLAGHLGLERLIVCYDDNHVTIDGHTDLAFSEDVEARFAAYGWRTMALEDPNDLDLVDKVFGDALQSDGRPTLIRARTVIGFGSPNLAGTAKAHSDPMGPEEVAATKEALGWPHTEPFTVPDEVREVFDQRERGARDHAAWTERFEAYREAFPELAAQFERVMAGRLPDGWDAELPSYDDDAPTEATRVSSGTVINALAGVLPELVGGSADLASSNKTTIADGGDVTRDRYDGRNLHFGVREHAMAAMLSGLTLHRGLRGFGATFLTFSDYARPSIRLAALMGLPVIYVMTHDSVGLGQDGPTHQPVEHLASLRTIPNLVVLRPADARETVGAWREAIARTDGPTMLVLTRQGVPPVDGTDPSRVRDGAYVLDDEPDPDVVLLATGSEVHVAVEAQQQLAADDIVARVVTMPSWEFFEQTDESYQDEVLPADVPVLSVEAAVTFGWERWADDSVGLDRFGASAPGQEVLEAFGFTGANVADAAAALLEDDDDLNDDLDGDDLDGDDLDGDDLDGDDLDGDDLDDDEFGDADDVDDDLDDDDLQADDLGVDDPDEEDE